MLKVVFTGGPADGATHDYPDVDVVLAWVHLIDYATGRPTAVYQRTSEPPRADGRWRYRDFVSGGEIMDEQLHFNLNSTLRGGWELTGSLLLESFGYPYEIYGDYRVEVPRAGGGAGSWTCCPGAGACAATLATALDFAMSLLSAAVPDPEQTLQDPGSP